MPLAWAHAEYVKLLRSMEENKVWDMPPQTVERYVMQSRTSPLEIWTENAPREWVSRGKQLRMDLNESGSIHWSTDASQKEILRTAEPIFGLHSVLLPLPVDWKYVRIVIEQDGKTRNLRLVPR